MTVPHHLAPCITCHAWNGDKTRLALCPNDNNVIVFKVQGTTFTQEHVLAQHDSVVTGIDWAPKTNRLVTCSQDRNAYVWHQESGIWKPDLVILRINRAATHVKWSPNEDKFAVASGAKVVSVCNYEEDHEWWVSKHIKKHKSTVTHVAWHPENCMIATASTDFKVRVFSAAIRGVDKRPAGGPFGKLPPFGEPVLEVDCGGWIHSVAWNSVGTELVYVGHDSSISFVDCSGGAASAYPQVIKLNALPLRDVLFLSDTAVVAVGYDCNPMLFSKQGQWAFKKLLDEKKTTPTGANKSAFEKIRDQVDKGSTDSCAVSTQLDTKHQNTISCIQAYKCSGPNVSEFTTTALDGNLIIWKA